jgi:hypothetical protein
MCVVSALAQETWVSLQQALAGMPALQDLSLNLKFEEHLCDDDEPPNGPRLMGGPQLSSSVALTRLELSVQPVLPGPGKRQQNIVSHFCSHYD